MAISSRTPSRESFLYLNPFRSSDYIIFLFFEYIDFFQRESSGIWGGFFFLVGGGEGIDLSISNVETETGSVHLGLYVVLSQMEPVFKL